MINWYHYNIEYHRRSFPTRNFAFRSFCKDRIWVLKFNNHWIRICIFIIRILILCWFRINMFNSWSATLSVTQYLVFFTISSLFSFQRTFLTFQIQELLLYSLASQYDGLSFRVAQRRNHQFRCKQIPWRCQKCIRKKWSTFSRRSTLNEKPTYKLTMPIPPEDAKYSLQQ